MIVIGVDLHQHTQAACAVDGRTGELLSELTVPATRDGHARLLPRTAAELAWDF